MEGLQELGMQPVPTTPTMESSPVRSSPDLQSMEFLHQIVQRRAPPRSSLQPNPFQQGSSGRIMSQFRFVAEE